MITESSPRDVIGLQELGYPGVTLAAELGMPADGERLRVIAGILKPRKLGDMAAGTAKPVVCEDLTAVAESLDVLNASSRQQTATVIPFPTNR